MPDVPFTLATSVHDPKDKVVLYRAGGERGSVMVTLSNDDEGRGTYRAYWVDPVELLRNVARFVPEVEPVGLTDSDGLLWKLEQDGLWHTPTTTYPRTLDALERDRGTLTALYAHPPVTAEPAREHAPEAQGVIAQALREAVKKGLVADQWVLARLLDAGYVVTAEPATAPSVRRCTACGQESCAAVHMVKGGHDFQGPATVPSVEQIVERVTVWMSDERSTKDLAEEIRALFASRAPEGSTITALLDARRSRIAALEAEVTRLKEAQRADGKVMYANGDEIVSLRAALEAADTLIDDLLEAMGDDSDGLVAEALRSMRTYAAIRAALDADTTEEAGCVCGDRRLPGVDHRTDGPCVMTGGL